MVVPSKVNNISPVAAFTARNLPLPSPKNIKSPAMTTPDFAGWSILIFQAILPVVVSVAPYSRKLVTPSLGVNSSNVEPKKRPHALGLLVFGYVKNVVGSYRVPEETD